MKRLFLFLLVLVISANLATATVGAACGMIRQTFPALPEVS